MQIKICFLTTSLSTGGVEMYLLRFLKFLDIEKYSITVLVRSNVQGELEEEYKALPIRIVKKPLGYVNPIALVNYYRFFKNEQFDVICDFNANFAGLPMLLAKWAGVKKRITFYRQGRDHFPPSFLKNIYNRWVNRLVYKHATRILSNSKSAVDFFFPYRTTVDPRFKVIRNGLRLEDYQLNISKQEARANLGLPVDAFIIGHVGRLDPAKNHSTIIKVFQKVKEIIPYAHLVLCGRGTKSLKRQLKALGVLNAVTMWEYRDDIPVVLHSLDTFFFPSLTEGQPNALIEAMISGVPIVASNIPSIMECVPKEGWGQLTAPMDIEGFVERINEINEEHYNIKVLQQHAMAYFDAKDNFRKFEAVLVDG